VLSLNEEGALTRMAQGHDIGTVITSS